MSDAMLDRIATAETLQELDSVRVALLGKSGEITAKLKSLGAMDAETRAAEAPKIHALREQAANGIAERKAALGITDNLVRISIGVEKAEDLIADFENALRGV